MDTRKMTNIVKRTSLVFIIPLAFLFIGIFTLRDYGINWDEPFHFMRGQAYLHFFLTGKKDYSDLATYPQLSIVGDTQRAKSPMVYEDYVKQFYPKGFLNEWRSYYQTKGYEFDDIIKLENGHPPVNDIMAAFTNYVFFQRLHILGDLESYHLFEVVTSFTIVVAVAIVTFYYFGTFPSIVASFSLAAYPLFFSESHFNIKDPPEAVFYGLTVLAFYFGIVKNRWKLIILSAFFAALALGTKFNAFFLFPTLCLWLLFYIVNIFVKKRTSMFRVVNIKKVVKVGMSLVVFPFIVFSVFYALWPYLWPDPLKNILIIINFYKGIGLGAPADLSRYMVHGWDTYPVIWIFYTTPIPVLILSIIGLVWSFYLSIVKRKSFASLLVIWFLIPILRVSLPTTSVYGGVRQFMEFLPPMSIFAGMGTYVLISFAKKFTSRIRFLPGVLILSISLSMVFVLYEMAKIHPNENVYFNQLIGGLSGAKEKNIPYWGNSYGNAYLQGVKWLNANAEPNAKLGLPIAYPNNLPPLKLRTDIDLSNAHWSGTNRQGEYEIELDFDWAPTSWYSFAYYEKYLDPVFTAQVDGVPLLKVWKNDLVHTKKGFDSEKIIPITSITREKNALKIKMDKEIDLTRLTIKHSKYGCTTQKGGYISISSDGKIWERETEPIDYPQVPPTAVGINDENFVFLFAAKKAKYIYLETDMEKSCLLKNYWIEVKGLSG